MASVFLLNRTHVLNKDLNVSCSVFYGEQRVEHSDWPEVPLHPPPSSLPSFRTRPCTPAAPHCSPSPPRAEAACACIGGRAVWVQEAWKPMLRPRCIFPPAARWKAPSVTWPPYLHASCSRAGKVLVGLYLGALVVHGIPSAAHGRFACGFILLQAGFFSPQKKTKLDCDKYVAPNKNMQHLLSSFIWRRYTVNYIGYAITLCFNYIALARGRSASPNPVMEQGGNRKKGIWCNSSLQINAVSARPGSSRKNLIFHTTTTKRRFWKAKALCVHSNTTDLFFPHLEERFCI